MLSKIKSEITLNIKLESCKKAEHIHSDLRLKDIVNKKKSFSNTIIKGSIYRTLYSTLFAVNSSVAFSHDMYPH